MKIPSMGGLEIGAHLETFASEVGGGAAIVEVGCWVGAGTYNLCLGAARNPNKPTIHCFDNWSATPSEVEKLKSAGVEVSAGWDLLPILKQNIVPAGYNAIKFKKGKILDISGFSRPIGLYVDDASKRQPEFDHAMEVFKPNFVHGAIIVLMDFHYYKRKPQFCYQRDYMTKSKEFVFINDIGNCPAVFKYVGPAS